MAEIETYTLFCEEVRWENNGSPMMIGMMSPVYHPIDTPTSKFDKLTVATLFRVGNDVKEFSAELKLKKIFGSREEDLGTFGAEYLQEESQIEGMQWVSLSILPLANIELKEGESLVAVLTVEDVTRTTYLTAGSPVKSEDLPI